MKCLRCNLVNPSSTDVCKRCQFPLYENSGIAFDKQINIYRDADFLVIESKSALPKRCYLCNSANVITMKFQTLEYVPALDAALEFAVGSLIPINVFSSPRRREINLEVSICRRHRTFHRTFFKAGWTIVIFGILCFAAGIGLDNIFPNLFAYAVITAVVAFCFGMMLLYIEREKEIVSSHKYNEPYFWVKGFGEEYLRSFPSLPNSSQ